MEKISPISRDKGEKIPLYVLIYEQLYHLIETNYFKQGERLPGESTLAKELGVSRSSLRQALLILQEDGIINNVQGKGNFLAKSKKNIEIGLERLGDVTKMFNKEDYNDVIIDINYETPSKWLQTILQIKSNMLIAVIKRSYKINGEFACFCITIIPYDKMSAYNLDMNNEKEILSFIEDRIYEDVSSAKTEIKITTSGDFIAESLNISEDTTLILFEETMYTDFGNPIALSKTYFRPEFYDIYINRKKHSIL